MRTDHYIGIIRTESGGWRACRGVGSALVDVLPELPPCSICGERHASRRAAKRAHGSAGLRAYADVSRIWPSAAAAVEALLAELVPLYLRSCETEDGDPPPLILVPPIEGEGNAWEYLVDTLDVVRRPTHHRKGGDDE